MASLYKSYAMQFAFESFAMKAVMTMPALLFQKPHGKSKVDEHIACLKRRLDLW